MSKAELVNVLAPVGMAIFAWLSAKLAQFITAHTKNAYLQGALVRLNDTVFAVVKEIEQSVVAGLKAANADGVITPEESAKVKQDAVNLVKSHLGSKGLLELAKVFGLEGSALDALISTKIEAAVHTLRAEAPAADPS